MTTKKTVVFFHPDLGIGGAERLVVDAAVGLRQRGHRVVIFTSHCEPAHCFDEVRPGFAGEGGSLDVRVRGGSLVPASLLGGRFAIVCAIARQVHLLLQIGLFSGELAALREGDDAGSVVFFVDQLSAGLPLMRLFGAPIFFYCHFPDLLLARGRQRWWKRLYRLPFDRLEQWSMGFADAVAVNSQFTRGVVAATWPGLAAATDLRVVYPCIGGGDRAEEAAEESSSSGPLWAGMPFVLSINRFERKKDVGRAVRAFAALPAAQRRGARLVVAGGHDPRVAENVEYLAELEQLAAGLGLHTATAPATPALPADSALDVGADIDVLFLLSVPSALKARLLRSARLLVYTPAHEHFGIVPLEAMRAGLPVLACRSGGPTETVVDGETGWLCDADDDAAWTRAMARVLGGQGSLTPSERAAMAAAGKERVQRLFSAEQMAAQLDGILDEIGARSRTGPGSLLWLAGLMVAVLVLVLGLLASALMYGPWRERGA